jgi:preprotein translocase subunit SecG
MFILLLVVHIIVSLILILVVLLQSGKAGDLASAFGGAGTQTAFGARGATTFLHKATTTCAVIFMITSLGLSITYLRGTKAGSVMEGARPAATAPAPTSKPAEKPAVPAPTPAQGQPAPTPGAQPQQPSK